VPGCDGCGGDRWLPLPPDQVRFGFTVLGPRATPGGSGPPPLAAAPNPFVAEARFDLPSAGRLLVLDTQGRVLRRIEADRAGGVRWDGRDDAGRAAPPGLYFARFEGPTGVRSTRLVRLAAH
jgi:hypothetical protein